MSKKDLRDSLKRIFIGYRKMTPQIESSLLTLGIEIGRKQNHVVLLIVGASGKHSVPISSTGSDKREGLNIVAKIMRLF